MTTLLVLLFLTLFLWTHLAAAEDDTKTWETKLEAPAAKKRDQQEIWHLKDMERGCTRYSYFYHFLIQEGQHNETDGTYCKITVKPDQVEHFESEQCKGWATTNDVLEKYLIGGRKSRDPELFITRVTNVERQVYSEFNFNIKQWDDMQIPPESTPFRPGGKSGTQDTVGVALPLVMSVFTNIAGDGPAAKKRTTEEDPEVGRGEEVRTTGEERLPSSSDGELLRMRREASVEPHSLNPQRTAKRPVKYVRSEEENYDIVDAPQWTIDKLTRYFSYDERVESWDVEFNFKLISTNLDGTINTGAGGEVSCHFITYLRKGRDHRKESVWLQKCNDIDFFLSWEYFEHEDSAVVTVIYINPDKSSKSRIAWTSFQEVSDHSQFDTTEPFPTEEYVCNSDAWPCNTQS